MDTQYIGTGQIFEEISEWTDYVKAHDPLTEDMKGILTDNKIYTYGAKTDLDFFGFDRAGFEVILDVEESVRHDGDFGNGARVEADSAGAWEPLYRARGVTVKNFSAHNTLVANPSHAFETYTAKFQNVIAKSHGVTQQGAFRITGVGCEFIACRGVSELTAGLVVTAASSADLVLTNCTFEGAIGVDFSLVPHTTGSMTNVNTSGCATGFAGTYSGTYSNNASDDGTHPGLDGVLVTADPYEADGYTPSQAGQLTAAGINVGVTHGADGKPFALVPAIGAYPAYLPDDSVSP
ncbi:MAG: hypothetical protein GY814_14985, partial [Gammaproteobacteria bacterium]|nr:hypothetical protein [Gammaproteobacteria bacterium]